MANPFSPKELLFCLMLWVFVSAPASRAPGNIWVSVCGCEQNCEREREPVESIGRRHCWQGPSAWSRPAGRAGSFSLVCLAPAADQPLLPAARFRFRFTLLSRSLCCDTAKWGCWNATQQSPPRRSNCCAGSAPSSSHNHHNNKQPEAETREQPLR